MDNEKVIKAKILNQGESTGGEHRLHTTKIELPDIRYAGVGDVKYKILSGRVGDLVDDEGDYILDESCSNAGMIRCRRLIIENRDFKAEEIEGVELLYAREKLTVTRGDVECPGGIIYIGNKLDVKKGGVLAEDLITGGSISAEGNILAGSIISAKKAESKTGEVTAPIKFLENEQ